MLYGYALYAKKKPGVHILICLSILIVAIVHIGVLLETENVWLLLGIMIYLPVYLVWASVSDMLRRMPD
jgi:hypothetical protein